MRKFIYTYLIVTVVSFNVFCYAEQLMKQIPFSNDFWTLFRLPNQIGAFDCSNKCAVYHQLLIEKGIANDVVVIQPDRGRYQHALVRVEHSANRNGYRYFDPTKGLLLETLSQTGTLVRVMSKQEVIKEANQAKKFSKRFKDALTFGNKS